MHKLDDTPHFKPLPAFGMWRFHSAHDGFEVTKFSTTKKGIRLAGTSLGVEGGNPWHFHYVVELDTAWHTRRATIENEEGDRLQIETDGAGHWQINGESHPELDGCFDVDLEGSAVTNAAPVHRLSLSVGQQADAPAVYVRTGKLRVERLEQTYQRLDDAEGLLVFDYRSPRFGYQGLLRFAPDGLVVDYPEIASRVTQAGAS